MLVNMGVHAVIITRATNTLTLRRYKAESDQAWMLPYPAVTWSAFAQREHHKKNVDMPAGSQVWRKLSGRGGGREVTASTGGQAQRRRGALEQANEAKWTCSKLEDINDTIHNQHRSTNTTQGRQEGSEAQG